MTLRKSFCRASSAIFNGAGSFSENTILILFLVSIISGGVKSLPVSGNTKNTGKTKSNNSLIL
jgi:hypothetical protein